MKHFFSGIFLGVIVSLFFSSYFFSDAQERSVIEYRNALFDPIPASSTISQRQRDMTLLYGRLDYMVQQLSQLQETCAK